MEEEDRLKDKTKISEFDDIWNVLPHFRKTVTENS